MGDVDRTDVEYTQTQAQTRGNDRVIPAAEQTAVGKSIHHANGGSVTSTFCINPVPSAIYTRKLNDMGPRATTRPPCR